MYEKRDSEKKWFRFVWFNYIKSMNANTTENELYLNCICNIDISGIRSKHKITLNMISIFS